MKYFSVILCLFLCYDLSTQDPMRPFHGGKRSKEFFRECRESSGISPEVMKNLLHSSESRTNLMTEEGDSRNVGCFLACLYEKHGLMSGDTFVREAAPYNDTNMEEDTPKSERAMHMRETLNTCMDSADGAGDACEVALAFEKCMVASMPTPPPLE